MTHAKLPIWDHKSDAEKIEVLQDWLLDIYQLQLTDARNNLLNTLATHQPADQKETDDLQQMQHLIQQHPNIMRPTCEVAHITGSALVIHTGTGRVLLHYHKTLVRWLQFGGHAEDETDFAQVALREAHEESGLPDLRFYPDTNVTTPLDIDIHTIPSRKNQPEHLHLDLRYLLATNEPDATSVTQGESSRFRWLSFDEALGMVDEVDPALRRLIRKAQAIWHDQTWSRTN